MKLDATVGTNADDREKANKILLSLNDKQFLKLLREEITLIVLMVRVKNQEIREEKKERWEERQALETWIETEKLFEEEE